MAISSKIAYQFDPLKAIDENTFTRTPNDKKQATIYKLVTEKEMSGAHRAFANVAALVEILKYPPIRRKRHTSTPFIGHSTTPVSQGYTTPGLERELAYVGDEDLVVEGAHQLDLNPIERYQAQEADEPELDNLPDCPTVSVFQEGWEKIRSLKGVILVESLKNSKNGSGQSSRQTWPPCTIEPLWKTWNKEGQVYF